MSIMMDKGYNRVISCNKLNGSYKFYTVLDRGYNIESMDDSINNRLYDDMYYVNNDYVLDDDDIREVLIMMERYGGDGIEYEYEDEDCEYIE